MSLLIPGDGEQPGFLVEERLDLRGAEGPRPWGQVEDHAGIERAGPGAHAQPVERGESQRAVDALAVLERAQAGATPEMGDDDAVRRRSPGWGLGQHRGDVPVRQPVEAVALHAFARPRKARGQRHQLGDGRLAAMEAGVEAGRGVARRAAARRPRRWRPGCAADGAAPAA